MKPLLVAIILLLFAMTNSSATNEPMGIIGKYSEEGLPVIVSLDNQLPPDAIRENLPWLLIVSWKYDGSSNNGMPVKLDNERMITLEDVLLDEVFDESLMYRAYFRTGNNLKEFAFYIADRNWFIDKLNKKLEKHSRYPIEIIFYEDKAWTDLSDLLGKFIKD